MPDVPGPYQPDTTSSISIPQVKPPKWGHQLNYARKLAEEVLDWGDVDYNLKSIGAAVRAGFELRERVLIPT
jgi:hypothetical protein